MADPWLGEIKLLPFDFVPRSYAACDGALMSIAQNTALFTLLGTTYGGDGRTTFALPDLRGRMPLQRGPQVPATQVSLSQQQLPQRIVASAAAIGGGSTSFATRPNNHFLASASSGAVSSPLDSACVGSPASALPHSNTQPNFVIALVGALPSRG
ncbi:MAG TPA: tail fiber protein [Polyangiales bacterium]|nr:tail fiber protein [Polyangiales bacterium]